jgi:prevent-host-death family protein
MDNTITANELKTKGVTILDEITHESPEVIITVRGKSKYVVMTIDEYNHLREYELEMAIKESIDDVKNGRIYDESIDEHLKRITGV